MRTLLVVYILCTISLTCKSQKEYSYRYWFDNNINTMKISHTSETNIHLDADVSFLNTGFHSFNYQVIDSIIGESVIKSTIFYKTPTFEKKQGVILIDDKPFSEYSTSENLLPSLLHFDILTDSVSLGLHTITFNLLDDSGISFPIGESFFMRIPTFKDIENFSIYYYIDNNISQKEKCTVVNDDTCISIHSDLDLTTLKDGLHTITFLLGNNKGLTTQFASTYFFKEPLGGNGIISYEYWVNDDNSNSFKKIFDTPQQYIHIVDILNLPHYPLRSENFSFSINNSIPVIYPCNSFKVMFRDVSGRSFSSYKEYTDITMPLIIDDNDIQTIMSSDKVKIRELYNNKIAWYKFIGEEGDSISVYADKSCHIDIFSPNGNIVKKYNGYESTKSNGFFLFEDGVYYIAVHDAMSNISKDVEVNFYKLSKYAIVDYDVHKVGNGGLTTISINGNGFYNLDSIRVEQGKINIPCVNIERSSNTKAKATFDFGGMPIGNYEMKFFFTDDTISISNGIYVEEAKDITLDFKVDYESVFYIGHEPYYNISVTNSGNNTALSVPIYIYIETKLSDGAPRIKLKGIKTSSLLDNLDMSCYSEEDIAKLKKFSDETGDSWNFFRYRKYDEESQDSILISSNYFFIDVPPMATKELKVSIATTDTTKCYVIVPDKWPTFTDYSHSTKIKALQNNAMDYFCCYHDIVECFLNVSVYIADIIAMAKPAANAATIAEISSCVLSYISSTSSYVASIFCSEESAEGEKNLYEKLRKTSETISITSLIKDCALRTIKKWGNISNLINFFDNLSKLNNYSLNHVFTNIDCITAIFSKKPNCPPIPPDGGECIPVQSYDPNDILGYISKSGSYYIGLEQKNLTYTIEFENDSTMATASAHKILIEDYLEPSIFDLSTLYTKKIVIGDKTIEVDANGEFVQTIDMRPKFNSLAEIRLSIDKQIGKIKYEIIALDPMTIEPTNDFMAGVLPINNSNGDGQGYIEFDINIKDDLDDGTYINNSASIIFDSNNAIETPIWTNITDYTKPKSIISNIDIIDNSNIRLFFEGIDDGSGIWKYDLYYQLGKHSNWMLLQENIIDSTYDFNVCQGIDYGFCVISTDKAENKEGKKISREYSYFDGQISSSIRDPYNNFINEKTIYDLSGKMIPDKTRPGIYIMKGKKIIIK